MSGNGFDPDFASAGQWARLYRSHGVQVVPACSFSEVGKGKSWKRPLLKSWTDFQDALVPDDVFERWYGPGGQYATRENMGVITGRASSNLFVIDLDTHKNAAAAEWWRGLLAVHNNFMDLETVVQRTGGGGLQLLFRAPAGWIAPTNKTVIGVDIRGQGGFAMLAPSLHESGKHYEWLEGRSPDDLEVTMAPDWLLSEVETLVRLHGGVVSGQLRPVADSPQLSAFDAFGHQVDGREEYMRNLLWAAFTGFRNQCPIPPGTAEKESVWNDYAGHCGPKIKISGENNADGLEREGRGRTLFEQKWARNLAQWDTDIKDAAFERIKKETYAKHGRESDSSHPGSLEWLDMSNWDNLPVPLRKWAILDRVPLNQVGLFSGEGGTGKSIIELMKNVAHVTGKDWFGSLPEQGGAFYIGAEDEADEIHIRLAAICAHYRTTFKELIGKGLKVLPLLGKDSMLCVQSGRGNHIEVTPLYRQLLEAAGDLKPKNISIDTLSRAFGGDEINRVQVYAFAMHMQAIAKAAQGSVTILSHPSLAGMASGSGISGSTAWHGAFRFRQYLKGVRTEEDADPADDDLRELEFKKNQYGPKGRSIILRYKDGLFLPVNGTTDPERVAREAKADGCFINLLRKFRERDDDVSHKPKSHYYAPRLFADETVARQQGFRKSDFEAAMRRLMDAGRVLIEIIRRGDRSQSRLILSPGL